MTFPGDSGEKSQDEGGKDPSGGPDEGQSWGAYEAPPIEQAQQPAYGAPPTPQGYSQPAYPPPGYPPPPSGYPPSGYQDPASYGASYPPPPPYGAPAPGYGPPYGGYPPSDYAGGYGPLAPSGTNTMAIGSLVASVIGVLCGIGSIVGIVLGSVALSQIKQTRQEGYGLAVAGIVVGIASLIISLVWMIFALR